MYTVASCRIRLRLREKIQKFAIYLGPPTHSNKGKTAPQGAQKRKDFKNKKDTVEPKTKDIFSHTFFLQSSEQLQPSPKKKRKLKCNASK